MKISSLLVPAALLCVAAVSGRTAPAQPAFDVATVKPSPPLTPELLASGGAHNGVRIDKAYAELSGMSLRSLIAYAYRVKPFQVSGMDPVNGARFDVLAKLPAGAPADEVPEMLRALLAERFHLKLHAVNKDSPVYALVVGKGGSKLSPKPAAWDFSTATKDLAPMTMDAYATFLSNGLDRPVVNQTGLSGEYMVPVFAVFRAISARHAAVGGQRSATAAEGAPTDGSAQSLLDSSITEALVGGLRLEPRRTPLTTLVIDHVDENPTAN